jgi:hypothetical protein
MIKQQNADNDDDDDDEKITIGKIITTPLNELAPIDLDIEVI